MNSLKNTLMLLPLTVVAVGCGKWEKNPVPNLDEYRKEAQTQQQQGTPQPRVITKEIIVEKPQVVVKEESSIDEKFIVITPDAQMTFNEGQEGKFNVRVRALMKGVVLGLKADGLPEGAKLEASKTEKDLYVLTWTPALYTLAANASMKTFTAKLVAQIVSTENSKDLDKLKALVREKEVNIFLFRNQEAPSALNVQGLANEVTENTQTAFTVTVKVPGIDGSAAQKPRLVISYDGVSLTAGNNFLEHDGSRHVIADVNKKDPEYVGDSTWKFSLVFDTKNIPVQPQLAKDGTFIPNANGTRVRLSFKVYSPFGLSTAEKLTQIKINRVEQTTSQSNKAAL